VAVFLGVGCEPGDEDLRDGLPAAASFGRAMTFWACSYSAAASAVVKPLRLRLPFRSRQSAYQRLDLLNMDTSWTPVLLLGLA
jgi:hypothetical protein